MITNERQYRITKRQLTLIQEAIRNYDVVATSKQLGSERLAQAEIDALQSEESLLIGLLGAYDALRSGAVTQLTASNLVELPKILIQARIAKGLTQKDLSDRIGLKEQQIQRYESEEYRSANLRRLQQVAEALDLNITEIAEFQNPSEADPDPKSMENFNWEFFPVKEMYRRHWFEGFEGSQNAAIEEADTLVGDYFKGVFKDPVLALHKQRVRAGSTADHYSLLAWEARVLSVALKMEQPEYQEDLLNEKWVADLVKLSSADKGPLLAKAKLAEVGIAMIVEPHLTGTHLDGAAILGKNGPVIGLTLRYDRIDNFWFVLLHELFHVIRHLRRSKSESIFDDLEWASIDAKEQEADSLALDALINPEIWKSALPRYLRTSQSVFEMAGDLHVHPAIIAGRIRHEANNYVLLKELIGQGEVRKLFPEAGFGV